MDHQPPKWAQRLISWYCKPGLAEDLVGDLNEYFERNVESKGLFRAKVIYFIDAVKFFRTYTVRTPKFVNPIIDRIMIGSYVKTSGRNVLRNKLFSSINIVGLAISMSVGLLMIAFVHDLLTYDRFNKNGDRIYRVITTPSQASGESNKTATTSVKAGHLIRERVPGVEQQVILRSGFGGDAKVGEDVFPLGGLWAEASLFKVFSFPLVAGNPETALSKPYTVVINESTAKRMFGDKQALGQVIRFDTSDYEITGVMKDLPKNSHIRFDAFGSFSTYELRAVNSKYFLTWASTWSNYVYLLLPENANIAALQSQLDNIADEQNALVVDKDQRALEIQHLYDIVPGRDLANEIGAVVPITLVWAMVGLALVVILSACFNYTNLSIARSMRRFKEIGLRKAIGANRNQVRHQFLFEAIIVSLIALPVSFALFLWLRTGFLDIDPALPELVTLDLTPAMVTAFVLFSIAVGTIAGFMPALFFAKINVIQALKDASSVKMFRHMNIRRSLVVVQYTLTLIFITATVIGYNQYKKLLAFDLGFSTENILNVELLGNKSEPLMKELAELPEVEGMSRSIIVNSVGNNWGGHAKYETTKDSAMVWYNIVDENYFKLHDYQFVSGGNFVARPVTRQANTEIVVNESLVKKFNIAGNDPLKAIGEEIVMDGTKRRITGVIKDFHYGKLDQPVAPVLFIHWIDETDGWINLKLRSGDPVATREKVEAIWKKIDRVHPLNARFYSESIEAAYNEYSFMITIIGFLSFLAISIASMGLFGMVVFTTETKLKEISIRKVMGASPANLILLLSRGFMIMLGISAAFALPVTWFVFENLILTAFPFHSPVGVGELFLGSLLVLMIAFIMISTQTLRAARTNPAQTLRSE